MSQELQQGVIVPIITPYRTSEILPLVDHITSGGVPMIFLLGTTGESPWQTLKQKKELIQLTAPYIKKRAQLLIGITGQTLKETMELMELAEEVGAFASVLAARALGPDCAFTIEKLLSAFTGNLLLYNYPDITSGQPIPLEHVFPFASEKRVLGIKDSSGNMDYFNALLTRRSFSFKVYYGPELNLETALKKEIDGFVPGTGNLEPKLACELWEKKENGPWTAWNASKEAILKKSPDYITGLKLLLQERSLISDARRFEMRNA